MSISRNLETQNADADWPIIENIRERRLNGTFIPADEPTDALRVDIDTGTLGVGGGALTVTPGRGQVAGTTHEITAGDDRTIDVPLSGGSDRRDAVVLTDAGTLELREGPPGELDWGDGVSSNARTFANAYLPPPPDLVGVAGLVLAIVTVRSGQNELDSDSVDSTVRVGPPTVGAVSGRVVALAPGVGVVDAFDPQNPAGVQDAIDAIEAVGVSADGRYGAGKIRLPAGVVETAGELHSMGGKAMVGVSREGTVLRVTDSSANCFAIGGPGSNATKAFLDGFTIDGGSRGARSGGSAINCNASPPDANPANMISIGFNIGALQFKNWGGSDPVIDGFGAFSAQWGYLRAMSYDGPFLAAGGGWGTFDNHVRQINANHGTTDVPVVDLDGIFGPVHIGGINAGGACHRVLRADSKYSRHAALYVEDINVEPDRDNAGTLPSSVAPAPVEIYGATPAVIGSVHQASELTSDYTVAVGGSQNFSSPNNDGPAWNQLGHITYEDGSTKANVGVLDAPQGPSWYWGPSSHIDYNGHDPRALVPLAEVSLEPDQTGSGGGPSLSTPDDVTGGRAISEWYQNTSGSPLYIEVFAHDTAGGRASLVLQGGETQDGTNITGNSDAGNGQNPSNASITALIPDGDYYRVVGTGLSSWRESTLT